ncbi:MAG: LuxR C-terminal-related transcriptional regulator [Siphonobacter sp.]
MKPYYLSPRELEYRTDRLTYREQQVLAFLAQGMSYKMIAHQCGITFHTVQTHLKRVYLKLGVNSGTEAIVYALRHGIISL